MAAAHERDEDGGDDDGGAEHDQVVLEPHDHRGDCAMQADTLEKDFRTQIHPSIGKAWWWYALHGGGLVMQ
jgi:hypothetical protein